jgi:RNA polymerase sigma-70 factor (ECF subfamily)
VGASTGDRDAWRELYGRYREFAFRAAFRFLGSEAEARDVAQDVFVSLFSKARDFRPEGKFSTYLWRVVANRCLNERARARNRVDSSGAQAEAERVPESSERAPDSELERRQLQQRVQRAILELPERQRMAVVLSRYEGLSYEEIALALECSISSVESLLFRARQNLARSLSDP